MLHLILGGAGSGKSTRLTEAIAADVAAGKRAWLIIPEQQANLSERTMLPKLPTSAGLTFTITGFSRLCTEVTSCYGGGQISPLSKGMRALLMWQVLRQAGPLLQEYSTVSPRSDSKLTELLLHTVDELRAGAVTAEDLLRTAELLPMDSALRPKLTDLSLLCESYEHALSEACDGGCADEIAHLGALLAEHDHFAGGNVYIDSFTDFTAEELIVLRYILRQADRVMLTLCCDDERTTAPAMVGVANTLRRICELCDRDGIPVKRELLTENHRAKAKELAVLERALWDFSIKETTQNGAAPTAEEEQAITLMHTANIYAESEAVALHILDLVHHGTRYGDIAVVFRDTETYRGVLDAALERHGIPYYFSEKTALTDKPLSRLMLSALRSVAHNWQQQDIMTLLKTGLCPVEAADIDLFEQYVATWNLNGSAFAAPTWTRNPDGYTDRISPRGQAILEAANRVRETIMTPLLRLHAATSRGGSLPSLCAALYRFMQELGLAERCAALAHSELAAEYLRQAGETVRVWDTVCMTLTQISARAPSLMLDIEEFSTVLRMVFDATEIASVPSLHDSVTLGSADTLRVENIEASFVLGLCEGEFPAAVKDQGLLAGAEKEQLRALGLHLDGLRETQAANELLYVWRAMTKPSRRLFVSTIAADTQGKGKSPSLAYHRVQLLFPYLKSRVRRFDFSMTAPTDVYDLRYAVLDYDEGGESDDASVAIDSYTPIPPSPHDPDPAVMSRYFGDSLYLSQSKIERFVLCPYSFYCRDLLGLREKSIARVDAASSGTFVHYVFEHFLRDCLGDDGSFILPTPDQTKAIASRIVDDYVRSLGTYVMSDLRTLHVFRRLKSLTLLLLRDVLDELAHTAFRPTALEHKIGGRDATTPYYEITLTDGHRILLGGVVDRIDCYRREDEVYLRVVDYKTGSKEFKLSDIESGLNLQLLIYLFCLCRAGGQHPAGVLYIATENTNNAPVPHRSGLLLDEPDIKQAVGERAPDARGTEHIISADADTFRSLEQRIHQTLRTIGEDMLHGRAARTPSKDACRFCPMKESCPEAERTRSF